jgi:hypothetical protein
MRLTLSSQSALEEALFHFLVSVRDGRPRTDSALFAEDKTIRSLYRNPHPDLQKAFCHCLDNLLINMEHDPQKFGELRAGAATLGITLAVHNCLAPGMDLQLGVERTPTDPVEDFTYRLMATLPCAGDLNTALAYHAVIQVAVPGLQKMKKPRAALFQALIGLSPLTELWAMDVYTPPALYCIAAECLPGYRYTEEAGGGVRPDIEDWERVAAELLSSALIARWLRHRWLTMPETRISCRNVGLFLEMLRRQGTHREFVLSFYEAYAYFCSESKPDERGGQRTAWPVLDTIEKLLRTPGDNEAAIAVNRRGNDYFMKFRPLIELIIEEKGIPDDYLHLSREFVGSLRPLMDYTTEGGQPRISFGEVRFQA